MGCCRGSALLLFPLPVLLACPVALLGLGGLAAAALLLLCRLPAPFAPLSLVGLARCAALLRHRLVWSSVVFWLCCGFPLLGVDLLFFYGVVSFSFWRFLDFALCNFSDVSFVFVFLEFPFNAFELKRILI